MRGLSAGTSRNLHEPVRPAAGHDPVHGRKQPRRGEGREAEMRRVPKTVRLKLAIGSPRQFQDGPCIEQWTRGLNGARVVRFRFRRRDEGRVSL